MPIYHIKGNEEVLAAQEGYRVEDFRGFDIFAKEEILSGALLGLIRDEKEFKNILLKMKKLYAGPVELHLLNSRLFRIFGGNDGGLQKKLEDTSKLAPDDVQTEFESDMDKLEREFLKNNPLKFIGKDITDTGMPIILVNSDSVMAKDWFTYGLVNATADYRGYLNMIVKEHDTALKRFAPQKSSVISPKEYKRWDVIGSTRVGIDDITLWKLCEELEEKETGYRIVASRLHELNLSSNNNKLVSGYDIALRMSPFIPRTLSPEAQIELNEMISRLDPDYREAFDVFQERFEGLSYPPTSENLTKTFERVFNDYKIHSKII